MSRQPSRCFLSARQPSRCFLSAPRVGWYLRVVGTTARLEQQFWCI
jgi:hypothetical protein